MTAKWSILGDRQMGRFPWLLTEEISDNAGYCLGYDVWKHYKKETYYSLNQILNLIKDFKFGRKTLDDTSFPVRIITRSNTNH